MCSESAVNQLAARWVDASTQTRPASGSCPSIPQRCVTPASCNWSSAGAVDDIEPLLGQIQSPDLRMDAVLQAAIRLTAEDPQAAQALLRRHPLDPPRQQQFEAMAKQQNQGRGW